MAVDPVYSIIQSDSKMISTQGQHSVPFFLRLTHFLSVFGVTPWYNFDQRRLVRPTLFRCYSSVLIILLVTLCVALAYLRYHHVYDAEISFEMISDMILSLESLFTVSVTVLGMAYWNRDVWAELYDQFRKVDCPTRFLCKSAGKPFILRYGAAVFILGNFYLFSLHHIDDLVLEQQVNSLNIYYVTDFILTYYEFLITFTIVSITALIKSKYMCVNELLNVRKFKNDAFFNNVKEARILCLKIDEIVRIFNKLLGWPLLQIFFDFFLDILNALTCATMTKSEDLDYRVGGGVIIINSFYLLQSGVSFFREK